MVSIIFMRIRMFLTPANIIKTVLYFKRNGLKNTYFALLERIEEKKKNNYTYEEPSQKVLDEQREDKLSISPLISIVVPCYETKPVYLEDLILSIEEQSYSNYEIILADASETSVVKKVSDELNELYSNITYVKIGENKGISDNTNVGIDAANGDYIALLDHDDVLTKDALYYVVKEIEKTESKGISPILVYTDEDKTDTYLDTYYEPNFKKKINLDLIMTNNYVCHLAVYKSEVIKKLRLRHKFDGAQDFDLVLRTIHLAMDEYKDKWRDYIVHIPRVLYHWRCHEKSTAANPASKNYAYENGRKAVNDFIKTMGWKCTVSNMKHVGFYRVDYIDGVLKARDDVGAIGGPVFNKKYITGGAMNAKGEVLYKGLRREFSGYLHRASLSQDVEALDIRNISVKKQYWKLFSDETGLSYPIVKNEINKYSEEEIINKSIRFCNKLRHKGVLLYYDPCYSNEEI